uniref:Secreted protein n=1 Tax=Bactrocera dorsalis TaxID=27457 RepID=A0A034WLP1_BACDO
MSHLNRIFLILCIILAALYCRTAAKYVPGISYIDDVQLSYENGTWQCDRITCKHAVHGCKISIRNNPEHENELIRSSACYSEDGTATRELSQTQRMLKPKTVNIDIYSYIGAQSLYTTGYSLSWQEVKGTVAAEDWASVQQTTRDNMKAVDESNSFVKIR